MPSWIRAMLALPATPLSPLARYTSLSGLLYMSFGFVLYFLPSLPELVGGSPLVPGAEGLVQVIGFSLAVIGWFYFMGGRTNADNFSLATVADRLVMPAFLLPLVLQRAVDPALVVPVLILDPLMAMVALWLWYRQQKV